MAPFQLEIISTYKPHTHLNFDHSRHFNKLVKSLGLVFLLQCWLKQAYNPAKTIFLMSNPLKESFVQSKSSRDERYYVTSS